MAARLPTPLLGRAGLRTGPALLKPRHSSLYPRVVDDFRYARPKWPPYGKRPDALQEWFEIEALMAADAAGGNRSSIPKEAAGGLGQARTLFSTVGRSMRSSATNETKHDIIAYSPFWQKSLGPEARFVHQGHDRPTCFGQ